MSVTKGAFTGQLDDIDDLFPPLPKKRDAATAPESGSANPNLEANPQSTAETSAVVEPSDTTDEAHEDVVDAEVVDGLTDGESQDSGPSDRDYPIAASGMPTTAVSAPNLKKLRALTTAERARDHLTARTYGQVVLDAIEQNAEKLQKFWKGTPEDQGATGGGLFKRQPIVSKRRRHAEPTGQITLQGITFEDAHVIDRLSRDWGAPSRSAFIDQSLTYYFEDLEIGGA